MPRHLRASGRNKLPTGNQHSAINITAAAIGASLAAYYGHTEAGIYGAVGLIGSDLFLSPDLDGYASNAKRRWRKVGLHWIWFWYESFAHRSPLTHWPVLADMIRTAYLVLVVAILLFIGHTLYSGAPVAARFVYGVGVQAYGFVLAYPMPFLCAFLGQCAATGLHGAADWITGEGEKRED